MLTDPRVKTKMSLMKFIFSGKKRKLHSLYVLMNRIGKKYDLNIPQVAMSFCVAKGIVPICGCRKAYQVDDLFAAAKAKLTDREIELIKKRKRCVGKMHRF